MRAEAFGVGGSRRFALPGGLGLDRLSLLLLLALALSLTARIVSGWALPLWFDEAYTGTIASQRDVAGLVHWCLSEITGPAFYMPMWAWAKAAATSNAALRLPALFFSIAAPLLIAWRGHPRRKVRLYWAIFSLLWLPMLPLATEARPYPQLFFLGACQAILFVRLSKSPTLREAFAWTTVTALFVLTNYYALVISAFQGLALVASHRGRLLRLWPALLPLLAAATWMAFHLGFVIYFASAHAAGFPPMPPIAVLGMPMSLFGQGMQGYAILILLAYTHSTWWSAARRLSPEAQLVWTAIAAFALIFAAGMVRATFTERYATPAVPAILFGVALWAARTEARKPIAVAAMVAVFFVAMGMTLITGPQDQRFRDRRNLEFETTSAWLMQQPIDRLAWLKAAPSPTPKLDAEVIRFFFARAGRPVRVTVATYDTARTSVILDDRRSGILTDTHAPSELLQWIQGQRTGWACRSFEAYGSVACRPVLPR